MISRSARRSANGSGTTPPNGAWRSVWVATIDERTSVPSTTGAYAEALGFKNVIAFDMGGTTAKCALVENGRFSVESIYYAGGYVKGFPIKSSVINIVEVGSGAYRFAYPTRDR